MTDFSAVIGRTAGIISMLGFLPYLLTTLRRTTRPNRATWWIWSIVGGALCLSYRSLGAQEAIWVSASYVVGPSLIALLSLKYGEGGWSRLDRACLAGALVSLGLWWLTGSPSLALVLNVLLDLCGAVPTILKTYRDPASEDLLSWSLFLAGNTLNLFAISSCTSLNAMYPLYLFMVALSVVSLATRGRRRALPLAAKSG